MDEQTLAISIETLLDKARKFTAAHPKGEAGALVAQLADHIAKMREREESLRREAYLDGVRSAAKIVQQRKEALLGEPEGADGRKVGVDAQIRLVAATDQRPLANLKQFLKRLRKVPEPQDVFDRELMQIYYAYVNSSDPRSDHVIASGDPTRSLDTAVHYAQTLLPEGWWALSCSLSPGGNPPTALVGADSYADPDPETGATPALAMMAATLAALVAREEDAGRTDRDE